MRVTALNYSQFYFYTNTINPAICNPAACSLAANRSGSAHSAHSTNLLSLLHLFAAFAAAPPQNTTLPLLRLIDHQFNPNLDQVRW